MNWFTLPLTDEQGTRAGVAALWPLEPGRTASFTFIGSTNAAQTFRYREDWRVVGQQRVSVAGGERDVIVIERRQRGMFENNYDGTDTLWYDLQSRTFIRRNITVRQGQPGAGNFEATRISVPAGSS